MHEHKGHVHTGVIDENSMSVFAVLTKGFSVVAHHDKQRAVALPALVEPIGESVDLGIHEGNLAVICLGILRRRSVGIVRIVKMQPRKERPGLVRIEPGEGTIRDDVGGLPPVERLGLHGHVAHLVVIDVEPPVESEARIQYKSRHKCPGPIPMLLESRSECRVGGSNSALVIDSNPEFLGEAAGHDRAMRGQRQRDLRNRVLKKHTACGDRVEGWGYCLGVSVTANAIRTGGVERNEQDVVTGKGGILPGILAVAAEQNIRQGK
jgi:hypothetical protein